MRWIKWTGILAAIILVGACFMTWVIIPSKNITISGVEASGTNFGKPGYFHFITVLFYLFFSLTHKVWAKRANLAVTALNMAWAIRNYFIITLCRGGECPEKEMAIYLVMATSLIMLISALFPDYKLNSKATPA